MANYITLLHLWKILWYNEKKMTSQSFFSSVNTDIVSTFLHICNNKQLISCRVTYCMLRFDGIMVFDVSFATPILM